MVVPCQDPPQPSLILCLLIKLIHIFLSCQSNKGEGKKVEEWWALLFPRISWLIHLFILIREEKHNLGSRIGFIGVQPHSSFLDPVYDWKEWRFGWKPQSSLSGVLLLMLNCFRLTWLECPRDKGLSFFSHSGYNIGVCAPILSSTWNTTYISRALANIEFNVMISWD